MCTQKPVPKIEHFNLFLVHHVEIPPDYFYISFSFPKFQKKKKHSVAGIYFLRNILRRDTYIQYRPVYLERISYITIRVIKMIIIQEMAEVKTLFYILLVLCITLTCSAVKECPFTQYWSRLLDKCLPCSDICEPPTRLSCSDFCPGKLHI